MLRRIDGEAGQRVVDSLAARDRQLVTLGMPRALNATFVARKVFAERGLLSVDNTTT